MMKSYIPLFTILLVANTQISAMEKIAHAFSRGATHNVMIHNDSMSYDFYVTANNEKKENMHFVGRSKDNQTIAIPMQIKTKNNQEEAVLTIMLPLIVDNKYVERKKTVTLSAPAGKFNQLKQIDINYSKGFLGKKKGFKLKLKPSDLGIVVK